MSIIAVDPSISNLGYAVSKNGNIVDYGHKRSYSKYELHERIQTLKDTLLEKVDEYGVDTLVYEYPDKGKYQPTGVQTYIKLGLSIGMVLGLKEWEEVYQYKPSEWKNNKPKKETKLLIRSKGFDVNDNNTIDALGLMTHHDNVYKKSS